jgi:hypothetical protein
VRPGSKFGVLRLARNLFRWFPQKLLSFVFGVLFGDLVESFFEPGQQAIREAEALVARSGNRRWYAELHRLRAVFLAAMGADKANIQAWLCAAIRIAKEQKSVSLEKRAEATYAEHRRQKASGSGGRGFRVPLW